MVRDRKGVGQHDAAARLISTSGDLNDRIGCSRDVLEQGLTRFGRFETFEMQKHLMSPSLHLYDINKEIKSNKINIYICIIYDKIDMYISSVS